MNTREKLLNEAIRLFAQEGYERVTVNEVVEAANLTKGAFYHYFDSKEDLLAEIHGSYVEFAFARFDEISRSGDEPDAMLAAMIAELLAQIESYRAQVVILWDSRRSLTPTASSAIDLRKADIRHLFQRVIERGMLEGQFSPKHNSRLAALGIFGMAMWTYHWYRTNGTFSASDIAASFTAISLGGLRADPDDAVTPSVPKGAAALG